MAFETTPLPLKISPDILAALRCEAELTGRNQNAIAVGVLKKWADEKAHASNVLDKHLKRMGFRGIDGSSLGKGGADLIEEDQE